MKLLQSQLKSRLLQQRRFYRTDKDWFLGSLCQVLFRLSYSGPLKNRVIKICLRSTNKPFFVRLGSSDCNVLAQIFIEGEYDFLRKLPADSLNTVIDLGANVGFFSRWIHELYPSAFIVGVEPDAGNMRILRKNVGAVDMATRYGFQQACAAATVRQVQLNRTKGEWGFSMMGEAATDSDSEIVPTVTIDDIIRDLPGSQYVDLLKCDIEGAEMELFQNCSSWIGRIGSIAIETHSPYLPDDLMRDLENNGGDFVVSDKIDIGFGMFVLFLTSDRAAETTPPAII